MTSSLAPAESRCRVTAQSFRLIGDKQSMAVELSSTARSRPLQRQTAADTRRRSRHVREKDLPGAGDRGPREPTIGPVGGGGSPRISSDDLLHDDIAPESGNLVIVDILAAVADGTAPSGARTDTP